MVIWHVLSHCFPGLGLLATQWTVMFKPFKMCFHMFPNISFVLVSLAANFTFPNSAAKIINNCPHWLGNQAIKICKALNIMVLIIFALKLMNISLAMMIGYVHSQTFSCLWCLSTILTNILSRKMCFNVMSHDGLILAGPLTKMTLPQGHSFLHSPAHGLWYQDIQIWRYQPSQPANTSICWGTKGAKYI